MSTTTVGASQKSAPLGKPMQGRKSAAWYDRKKTRLSFHQAKLLDAVYETKEQRLVPNMFSLAATLALYPELRDSYTRDWNLEDGQTAFSEITAAPILWKQATELVDPFA